MVEIIQPAGETGGEPFNPPIPPSDIIGTPTQVMYFAPVTGLGTSDAGFKRNPLNFNSTLIQSLNGSSGGQLVVDSVGSSLFQSVAGVTNLLNLTATSSSLAIDNGTANSGITMDLSDSTWSSSDGAGNVQYIQFAQGGGLTIYNKGFQTKWPTADAVGIVKSDGAGQLSIGTISPATIVGTPDQVFYADPSGVMTQDAYFTRTVGVNYNTRIEARDISLNSSHLEVDSNSAALFSQITTGENSNVLVSPTIARLVFNSLLTSAGISIVPSGNDALLSVINKNVTWAWPLTDTVGVFKSNGSGVMSIGTIPAATVIGTPTHIPFFDVITGELTSDGLMVHDLSSGILLTVAGTDQIQLTSVTGSLQTDIVLNSKAGGQSYWDANEGMANVNGSFRLYDASQTIAPRMELTDHVTYDGFVEITSSGMNLTYYNLASDNTTIILDSGQGIFRHQNGLSNSLNNVDATQNLSSFDSGTGTIGTHVINATNNKIDFTDSSTFVGSVSIGSLGAALDFDGMTGITTSIAANASSITAAVTDSATSDELGFTSTNNLTRMGGIDSNYRVAIETNATDKTAAVIGTFALQGTVSFSGSGTDDFTPNGSYTGSIGTSYAATVDGNDNDLINYTGLSGSILPGDTLLGSLSGATGTFVAINTNNVVVLTGVTGTFQDGENGTVTSGPNTGNFFTFGPLLISHVDTVSFTDGTTTETYQSIIPNGVTSLQGVSGSAPGGTGHTIGDNWSWAYSFTGMKTFYSNYLAGTTSIGDVDDQITSTKMVIDWINRSIIGSFTDPTGTARTGGFNASPNNVGITMSDISAATFNTHFNVAASGAEGIFQDLANGVISNILLDGTQNKLTFTDAGNSASGEFKFASNSGSVDAVLSVVTGTFDSNLIIDATSTRLQRNAGGLIGSITIDPASTQIIGQLFDNSSYVSKLDIRSNQAQLAYVDTLNLFYSSVDLTGAASALAYINQTSTIQTGVQATDQVIKVGVINGTGNNTNSLFNDIAQTVILSSKISVNTVHGLFLDWGNDKYYLGDDTAGSNGGYIIVDNSSRSTSIKGRYVGTDSSFFTATFNTGTVEIGDVNPSVNGTKLTVDDSAQTYTFNKLAGSGNQLATLDNSGVLGIGGAVPVGATYTPTLTNVTNVTSSTAANCQYTRVGNIVTVFGSLAVTTTLAVATEVDISLPVASNLGATTDANGTGSATSAIATNVYIDGDATNDRARMKFIGLAIGGAGNIFFSFSYTVI